MIMIILSHYQIFGRVKFKYSEVLAPLGEIGVGIFVMISAYFLTVESNSSKKLFKRVLNLWCHVIFYTWIILIADIFIKFSPIDKKTFVQSVFPILGNSYWFVTSFFLLMLIVPLLNKIIKTVNRQQLLLILAILILFSGVTTIIGQPFTPFGQKLNVGVMISEYILIGYYRKYQIRLSNLFLITVVIVFYVAECLVNEVYGFPSIILSAALFILAVQNLPSYHSHSINWIASSVFASYLITEDNLFRKPFWKISTSLFVFHNKFLEGFVIVIVTIIVTVLVDKIYLLIFNSLIKKRLNIVAEKLTRKFILEK